MSENKTIKKVAVLGGGIGSMSAVYELLKATQNDPDTTYQITVYQMGWRLGGKGASGRNAEAFERIEEHGLHMWFGMYNNAFNQIKAVYDELNRPPNMPLATWKAAFTPENRLAAEEWLNNAWRQDDVILPQNDLEPGGNHEFLPPIDYLEDILSIVLRRMAGTDFFEKLVRDDDHPIEVLHEGDREQRPIVHAIHWIETILEKGLRIVLDSALLRDVFARCLEAVRARLKTLLGDLSGHHHDTRCAYIMLDIAFTTVIGILEDNVLENGFDSINEYDLIEWLGKHGAAPEALSSSFLRGAYDALFAFDGGDTDHPDIEAGTTLKCAMLAFGSRGSVLYKMNAGMGDVIFGPCYEVLKRRGVQFKFFHCVKALELSADKKQIERIQIGQQVHLLNGQTEYHPLKTVKDLPSWPSRPLYEQLDPADAQALQEGHVNLESAWADWEDRANITLQRGQDFDLVIYGMSLGPVVHTCQELMAANPRFKAMAENVKTVQTQAFQLWTNKSTAEMGWTSKARVMGSYVQPLDTWSEMNQVLDREDWPPELNVKSISYFCGPMKAESVIPPPGDHAFPKQMREKVQAQALQYMTRDVAFQWPKGVQPNGTFDWNNLAAPSGITGEKRFDAQFFRANIDPSERYVLTAKGTSKYRLRTNDTGFDNLFLTGDWIDNGMNVGAVESAVMGGILCARAVSGKYIPIVGESILHGGIDLPPAPAGLYAQLQAKAQAQADAVKDDPAARLALRKAFYEKYGDSVKGENGMGYGDAEIAFMEWEIKRGVLNPLNGPKPGSPWWYNVNLQFIYWGELARLVQESGFAFSELDDEVSFWLDYIRRPSPGSWFRAHNRCIASGYVQFVNLAREETVFERLFMNEVLYRLLYSGLSEMEPVSKLPFLSLLAPIFDPEVGGINIMVKIPAFYPDNYPMTERDALNIAYQGRSVADKEAKDVDDWLILPHIEKIYAISADWLALPALKDYADRNQPIYPDKSMPEPHGNGVVKGKVQSLLVSAEVDTATIAAFLPPELELSAQQISRPGTHPLIVFFSKNRLHASLLPWPVFQYNELAFLIPYVNFKGKTSVYAFTPILFVDSRLVSWLGEYVWDFNKLLADFQTVPPIQRGWRWLLDSNNVHFETDQDGKRLADASCTNAGEPNMLNDLPNIEGLKTMLDLPGLMGREGKFSQVNISMNYETAEVLPVSGAVNVAHLDDFPIQNLQLPFGPLGATPFGGVRINWDLTLGSPFNAK